MIKDLKSLRRGRLYNLKKEEFKEILKKYNEGKNRYAVGIDVLDLKKVDLEEYKKVKEVVNDGE